MKSGRINSKKSKVNGRPFVRDFLNRHYKNHGIIFVFDNTANNNNNKREKSQSCFSSGIIFSLCLNIKLSI